MLQIKVKQDELARYGVPAKAVLDLVKRGRLATRRARCARASSGSRWWFGCRTRSAKSPEAVGSILVPTPTGERIPLSRLADIRHRRGAVHDHPRMGPAADHDHRNIRGRDLG